MNYFLIIISSPAARERLFSNGLITRQ